MIFSKAHATITNKQQKGHYPAIGRSTLTLALWGLLAVSLAGCKTTGKTVEPLRTVAAVQNLPEREITAGRRVHLQGVVTLFDPGWRLLAIQDETGGVLIDWPRLEHNLRLGDRVEVEGASSIDNHVRSIVAASVLVVGRGALPAPTKVSAEDIACGKALYRLVEVQLIPSQGSFGDGIHTAQFTTQQPCNRMMVIGRVLRQYSPANLVHHRLRVRGVTIGAYSPSGSLDQVQLMFEDDSNVDVLDPLAAVGSEKLPSDLPELKSLSTIKVLPRTEVSRGYPVRVEGVVTAPTNPRHDGYFLQQGSTGICVFAPRGSSSLLHPGQKVRIIGHTEKGGFAPVIRQASLQILGSEPLPVAVKINPGDVFHGWEENLWVEVEGLATAVVTDGERHQLELFAGPRRLLVWFSEEQPSERLAALIGDRVVVRGVYSPMYTASARFAGFRIFSPSLETVKVSKPEPPELELRTMASLSQFDARGVPQHRFRTSGTVTYRDSSGHLFLQDGDSSVQVLGNGIGDPGLNSRVTVDGFLTPEGGPPRIEHIHWVSETPGSSAVPTPALPESLTSGELEGRLVTVEGFLESRRTSGGDLRLELIAGRSRFAAHLEAPGSQNGFHDLRPGALVRLTGVSTAQTGQSMLGSPRSALWLRSADDITLMKSAPWWDLERALYAASAAFLLLLAVLAWVIRLRHNLVVQAAVRSRLEEQLLHAQKLESVGRLAGGVAHDFNNYLTVVLGYTSMLLEHFPDDGPVRMQLNTIREVGEKTASLTRQLLAFSRKQVLQPVRCNLNEVILDAKATLLPLIGEHIEIVMELEKVEPVNIDPAQFLQVLVNLAVNARDAMPDGGKLIFETYTRELGPRDVEPEYGLQPGRYTCVTISDTGAGMDRATRQRIFDPFFTTKEAGRGTGLGLAVVFGIIKQSNGHIQVQSRPGQGSRFRIYLPVSNNAIEPRETQSSPREGTGSETVLVVEDQSAVREVVCTALEGRGYRVLSAESPQQALNILDDPAIAIDLVLTDLMLPGMSGRLLATQARLKRPSIRILYMSGYSEEIVARQTSGMQRIDCIEKPFTSDQLIKAVREVLDRPTAKSYSAIGRN